MKIQVRFWFPLIDQTSTETKTEILLISVKIKKKAVKLNFKIEISLKILKRDFDRRFFSWLVFIPCPRLSLLIWSLWVNWTSTYLSEIQKTLETHIFGNLHVGREVILVCACRGVEEPTRPRVSQYSYYLSLFIALRGFQADMKSNI